MNTGGPRDTRSQRLSGIDRDQNDGLSSVTADLNSAGRFR